MNSCTPQDVLALKMVPGAGNVTLRRVLSCLQHHRVRLKTVLGKPIRELLPFFPSGEEDLAELIHGCDGRLRKRAAALLTQLERQAAIPILSGTPAYPALLERHLGKTAPVLFFVQGNISLLYQELAGIVGTRAPSREGEQMARDCARVFAHRGIPIVSGGARGVDSAAHEASLTAGGSTMIILPQGMLTYKMPVKYAKAVSEGKLLLISEFMPDAEWQTHAAVTRNATISALSRMIVVIEPHSVNGSLRTARNALEQGKPVFYTGLGTVAQPLARHPNAFPLDSVNPQTLLAAFHQPGGGPVDQAILF